MDASTALVSFAVFAVCAGAVLAALLLVPGLDVRGIASARAGSQPGRPFPPLATLCVAILLVAAFLVPVLIAEWGLVFVAAAEQARAALWMSAAPARLALTALGDLSAGAFVFWCLPRLAARPLWELGLRAPTRVDIEVGLAGLGMASLIGAASAIVLTALHQDAQIRIAYARFRPHGAAEFALAAIVLVIVAPVVEELIFRGLLFNAFRTHLPVEMAVVGSALLFGAVHRDPVLLPTLAALGAVNTWAYLRSGSLLSAIIAHAGNNALVLASIVHAATR